MDVVEGIVGRGLGVGELVFRRLGGGCERRSEVTRMEGSSSSSSFSSKGGSLVNSDLVMGLDWRTTVTLLAEVVLGEGFRG